MAGLAVTPTTAIILIIGALVLGAIILFLGLCFASLFLPVILVLVGVIALWRGASGNTVWIVVGGALILIGAFLWLWS